ncbi:hypothetical protein B0H16DRAFT_831228 [Mycena metata]|uniref:Uncharacterized protein n=1 Tax=Mycena metata TaxID=1033252 RepID=A0AAD7IYP7_9AGAR|nr:hypothetical protein B0H16DRAFT_831228 [Mycena metata]
MQDVRLFMMLMHSMVPPSLPPTTTPRTRTCPTSTLTLLPEFSFSGMVDEPPLRSQIGHPTTRTQMKLRGHLSGVLVVLKWQHSSPDDVGRSVNIDEEVCVCALYSCGQLKVPHPRKQVLDLKWFRYRNCLDAVHKTPRITIMLTYPPNGHLRYSTKGCSLSWSRSKPDPIFAGNIQVPVELKAPALRNQERGHWHLENEP